MPNLGMILKDLGKFVDIRDDPSSRVRVIQHNELEYVFEPALSLIRPVYFRHERMRWFIFSFEMTRPASESAKPR